MFERALISLLSFALLSSCGGRGRIPTLPAGQNLQLVHGGAFSGVPPHRFVNPKRKEEILNSPRRE